MSEHLIFETNKPGIIEAKSLLEDHLIYLEKKALVAKDTAEYIAVCDKIKGINQVIALINEDLLKC